ncbi:hypothetical protein CSUI_003884 [Cystoisospora suis]|uniref:Uncharacterized protein n=1 Tax=Cystoisospora suis TaxID=483139 RepID=A0A2C6L389_9APIC|nr:hypothetical protein CSUI_003884 [Cystoisospora suis]
MERFVEPVLSSSSQSTPAAVVGLSHLFASYAGGGNAVWNISASSRTSPSCRLSCCRPAVCRKPPSIPAVGAVSLPYRKGRFYSILPEQDHCFSPVASQCLSFSQYRTLPSTLYNSSSSSESRTYLTLTRGSPSLSDSRLQSIYRSAASSLTTPTSSTTVSGGKKSTLSSSVTVPAHLLFKALARSGLLADLGKGGAARDQEKPSSTTAPSPFRAGKSPTYEDICSFYSQGQFYTRWGGGHRILRTSGVRGLAPPGGNLKGGSIDGTPKQMTFEEFRQFVHELRIWLLDEASPVPLNNRVLRSDSLRLGNTRVWPSVFS